MQVNKKTIFILVGLIIAILAVIIALQGQKPKTINKEVPAFQPEVATTSEEEIAPSISVVDVATVTPEVLETAVQVAPGTSLVTEDNKVVTEAGTPVKLNVMPASVEAPKESAPIKAESVPVDENTIKVSVSAAGFVPNTFKVKEGQLVNFVLTSTDDFTHVWRLEDKSLTATILGVAGGETRVKSWNAPKKGTYTFRCDIPGHSDRGEKGTMIVE